MAGIGPGTTTVSTATTRVQVTTTPTPILSVTFTAQAKNAGDIYLGDSTVAVDVGQTLPKGASITHRFPAGNAGDLSDFWVDAAVSGDKVDRSAVTIG